MMRDLFKKIRATKGTFLAKMGSIKDRNGMNLTEAEDIKKRRREYIEELYKKYLHDQDNHDGVITNLSHSLVFLYFFALIAKEGFLISPCYSLELCIQMLISFLFSFAFHFSSFHRYL